MRKLLLVIIAVYSFYCHSQIPKGQIGLTLPFFGFAAQKNLYFNMNSDDELLQSYLNTAAGFGYTRLQLEYFPKENLGLNLQFIYSWNKQNTDKLREEVEQQNPGYYFEPDYYFGEFQNSKRGSNRKSQLNIGCTKYFQVTPRNYWSIHGGIGLSMNNVQIPNYLLKKLDSHEFTIEGYDFFNRSFRPSATFKIAWNYKISKDETVFNLLEIYFQSSISQLSVAGNKVNLIEDSVISQQFLSSNYITFGGGIVFHLFSATDE